MMGKSFTLYFVLNLIVALVCTMFAVPIYVFIFGGATGHFSDMMTAAFLAAGQNLITSVFSSNIIVSLADKVISGFVALAIIEALPKNLTSKVVLPVSTGMNKVLWILGGVLVGVAFALIYLAIQPK
jgi:energy-coupling factor transport system substrate-specific component